MVYIQKTYALQILREIKEGDGQCVLLENQRVFLRQQVRNSRRKMNGDTKAMNWRYLTHLTSLTLGTKQLMHIMKIESVVPAAWINTWNYLQKLAIQSVLLHLGLAMQCEKTKCVGFEAVMNALLAKKVDDLVDDECGFVRIWSC
eukprot:1035725_1